MEWKLVTLLALFAACGSIHAQDDPCSTLCKAFKSHGTGTRNVVRGLKHRASRSKGHRARASRQAVSYPDDLRDFCSTYCETGTTVGGISSRQGQSGSGGLFSSGFPNPFNIFSGGSGSSGSESGSSGGLSEIFGMPGEMVNSVFGGGSGSGSSSFPFDVIRNPFGSSSESSGSGSGTSDGASGSSGSGSGSSGSGSGSSGSGSGIFGIPGEVANGFFGGGSGSSQFPFSAIEEAISGQGQSSSGGSEGGTGSGLDLSSFCQQVCGYAVPFSRASRQQSSGRKGASHGHKERHGRQPTAALHTRQAGSSSSSSGVCPTFCRYIDSAIPGFGSSSTGSSGGSTGDSGTSSGSDGSSTTSQSGSSGGSTSGPDESSTGK